MQMPNENGYVKLIGGIALVGGSVAVCLTPVGVFGAIAYTVGGLAGVCGVIKINNAIDVIAQE